MIAAKTPRAATANRQDAKGAKGEIPLGDSELDLRLVSYHEALAVSPGG